MARLPFPRTSSTTTDRTRPTGRVLSVAVIAALLAAGCGAATDEATEGAQADGAQGAEQTQEQQAPATPTEEPEPEPAELPGGGTTIFPDRRMVALYGSPGVPALGALGEQDVDEAIARIKEKVEEYQEFSDEPVEPAFEIIATVASQDPGPDGDYTMPRPMDVLEPWIEAAAEEDVHIVLDLQPGRADFLSQAQEFEEFLLEPHVGLALDPEWRLTDSQVHGDQIGSVDAAEINEVSDWLAELTRENELPQKMLILHQFTDAMITDRSEIDTSHEELAITLHADGHGDRQLKFGTWNRLQENLPEGIWMAWKNFHEQDDPTFTPQETYEDVEPKPWFVSYQ